jgi:predicted dithiol-disulfide oxidoreductase (DUF899 family)
LRPRTATACGSRSSADLRGRGRRSRRRRDRRQRHAQFDTEDGKKTVAELFDGRSQLVAYNIMLGPDYEVGACPGCTNVGDGLDGALVT